MSRQMRLGAFIFGSLLVFAVGVFLVGDRQFIFSRTYHLQAPFETVAGLDDGAPVRAGGVRIGTVEHIRLPRQPGEKVIVEMELEESTRKVIKRDSIAAIETEGLLGNKYVAISFGTQESQPIRDGDTIQSQPPLDYADLAKKANDIMDTTKVALNNVNQATADLKSITGKIDQGEGTIGALVNDQRFYQSLNATTEEARRTVASAKVGVTAFQENMEALKHNWFLRGFFNHRGYFDSSDLTEHAIAKLPDRPTIKTFIFAEKDLFDKSDTAKLKKEKLLHEAGKFLEQQPFGLAVVTADTGLKGERDENLLLTQARAMVVRQYLAKNFKVNDAHIKTKGLGEIETTDPRQAGRVEIIIYPGRAASEISRTKPGQNASASRNSR